MPNRQDPDRVTLRPVSVKSDVPGLAEGDDQFPQVLVRAPANQRVFGKHAYRISNRRHGGARRVCIVISEKLERPLDVFERVFGISYLRHGTGRGGFSPFARRSIQACTSSAR